jgi:phage terminase large subunit-like protein
MTEKDSTAQTISWSTANPNWEADIRAGRSLLPCAPLFPDEAMAGLDVMQQLRIVDAPGSPTIGESCAPWVSDFAGSVFGAYDPETGIRHIKEFMLTIPKKNSKALALDTPIPTPEGWTTMGALREGDRVYGADGLPCTVEATSEVFDDHKCYRLTFSNGESVIADAGHLWNTKSLRDEKTKTRTTEDIAKTLFRPGDGARNHSMAMPKAIRCDEIDLPIPPYTLGAWLGDGHYSRRWFYSRTAS